MSDHAARAAALLQRLGSMRSTCPRQGEDVFDRRRAEQALANEANAHAILAQLEVNTPTPTIWTVTYEGGCGGPTGVVHAKFNTYEEACEWIGEQDERFKGHGIRPTYAVRPV